MGKGRRKKRRKKRNQKKEKSKKRNKDVGLKKKRRKRNENKNSLKNSEGKCEKKRSRMKKNARHLLRLKKRDRQKSLKLCWMPKNLRKKFLRENLNMLMRKRLEWHLTQD